MRVKVQLTSYDQIENTTTVLVDDVGILTGDTLKYKEGDSIHRITFGQHQVEIVRRGDVTTHTYLNVLHPDKSVVTSEFGVMELTTKTYQIQKEDDCWIVEYAILNGEDITLHQRLEWKITFFH